MKRLLFLFIFIGTGLLASAQDTNTVDTSTVDTVQTVIEKEPQFKEGKLAMFNYIIDNIQYPKKARKKGIQGTVYISFLIDTKGHVSEVKVLRGIGYGCDEEAIRVIQSMDGMWKPALQNGKPVPFRYTMPISFRL